MTRLSYQELVEADPDTLSQEDLLRRINLTQLKKAEREVELTESQNQVFQEKKLEQKRVAEAKTIIIEDENNRLEREHNMCKHKTGGKGLTGYFNGDGKQGYAVSTQQLPTKEVYFLCFRCQKEWRLPKKRAVLDAAKQSPKAGLIALAKYQKEEAEYYKVAAWDKPLFETDSGVTPGSVLFLLPRLEQQQAKDDAEFAAYLEEVETAPTGTR